MCPARRPEVERSLGIPQPMIELAINVSILLGLKSYIDLRSFTLLHYSAPPLHAHIFFVSAGEQSQTSVRLHLATRRNVVLRSCAASAPARAADHQNCSQHHNGPYLPRSIHHASAPHPHLGPSCLGAHQLTVRFLESRFVLRIRVRVLSFLPHSYC